MDASTLTGTLLLVGFLLLLFVLNRSGAGHGGGCCGGHGGGGYHDHRDGDPGDPWTRRATERVRAGGSGQRRTGGPGDRP